MARSKFLHEIIKDVIDGMTFNVSFKSVIDNLDGTYTLTGICNFHHVQPGKTATIGGHSYTIVDYDDAAGTLIVKGTDVILVTSFNLSAPFFCHGTPDATETENAKIPDMNIKTPMVYLMEPYTTDASISVLSAFERTCDITLCFLTEADTDKWITDDFYHNSIRPMQNLMEDFICALVKSNLFNTTKLKSMPTLYTKFGINIRESGTKKLWFSEKLSGAGDDLRLEIYSLDSCPCD